MELFPTELGHSLIFLPQAVALRVLDGMYSHALKQGFSNCSMRVHHLRILQNADWDSLDLRWALGVTGSNKPSGDGDAAAQRGAPTIGNEP